MTLTDDLAAERAAPSVSLTRTQAADLEAITAVWNADRCARGRPSRPLRVITPSDALTHILRSLRLELAP